ncbi:DUF3108 domain-containing protein [Paracidovorax citrulli]
MARQRRPQPPDFPDTSGPAGPSSDAPEPGTPVASPRVQRLRWAAAIAVVLIAHGLALFGLVRVPGPVPPEYPSHEPVEALLLPPPSPPEPPTQPLQPPPSTARQGEPAPARPSPPPPAPAAPADSPSVATVPEPPPAPAATAADAAAGNEAGLVAQGQASGNGAEGNGTEGNGTEGNATGATDGAGNNVPYAAPPSVTLHYASFVNGVQNPDGRIHWEQEDGRYRLSVETRVLWFRFAFRSEGALGAGGLLPDRYVEERRKRTSTTRFDRPAGKLIFESRGGEAALPPGAQDRFSVFLQLVGMVRANPSRYATPGVTETFQVADTDELEPMQVRYVGEEEVQTSAGPVRARHFVRLPRRAEDRRRVEIWLAEAVGWMPVKLQQTEPDGTRIELVLRDTAQ